MKQTCRKTNVPRKAATNSSGGILQNESGKQAQTGQSLRGNSGRTAPRDRNPLKQSESLGRPSPSRRRRWDISAAGNRDGCHPRSPRRMADVVGRMGSSQGSETDGRGRCRPS